MRDVSPVPELAAIGAARWHRSRGQTVIDERGVLGPDARVDDADDDVRRGLVLPAQRGPDSGRTDELRRVTQRLLEVVLLDGDDAAHSQKIGDGVGGHLGCDAAVNRLERLNDPRARDGTRDGRAGLVRDLPRVLLVAPYVVVVVPQLLAGDRWARRGKPGDAPFVRGRGVVVVLDQDVDWRRVGAPEQRRIRSCDVRGRSLGPDEG